MPSRLFESAASLLDPAQRLRLEALQVDLEGAGMPSDRQLVVNLQAEAHLVGDEEFGNASALGAFLRTWISGSAAPRTARASYEQSCVDHEMRGLPVSASRLPAGLLRYTTSIALMSSVIERVLGARARVDFDDELATDDLFDELGAAWDSARLAGIFLRPTPGAVFATFDRPPGVPRSNARALAEALALPLRRDPGTDYALLVEMSYPTGGVTETRFPTVADAGLVHLFRPAPDVEPSTSDSMTWHGWTAPLGPHAPQPEIVHGNVSATILDRPLRFVGRVPL